MCLKILDLFAGIGCSAREFQKMLDKRGIRYTYVAIEILPEIAKVHRRIATKSDVIIANAMDFLHPSFLSKFDFVWASPPCQKYSTLYRIKRNDYGKDDTQIKNRITDLAKAYGIPLELLNGVKDKGRALRNCLEPWIARAIFVRVVRVLNGRRKFVA